MKNNSTKSNCVYSMGNTNELENSMIYHNICELFVHPFQLLNLEISLEYIPNMLFIFQTPEVLHKKGGKSVSTSTAIWRICTANRRRVPRRVYTIHDLVK